MANIRIHGTSISPGQSKIVNLNIAQLASGTKIELPIYVFRSRKEGPVVLLSGGLHGDEVNGIEIIRRLIDSKVFSQPDLGSVIAIPVVNIYGFLQFSREVPDGKDINRSFPGTENGSLASRVAWHLTRDILSQMDIGIDFHTGGASRFNFPQVRFAAEDKKAMEMAKAFGAPLMLESPFINKSLRKQAHKMGKSILVYEGGESMRFDEEVIKMGIAGAKRILSHLGMISEKFNPVADPYFCETSSWIRARQAGLFHPLLKSGSIVNKNQVLGYLTDPFGQVKKKIQANKTGIIIGHNNIPVVNQGDALFHIGFPSA